MCRRKHVNPNNRHTAAIVCTYSSDSRRPRPLRVTVSPTAEPRTWTKSSEESIQEHHLFCKLLNLLKCQKNPKQKLTCPPLITFYLLHHTVAVFSLAIVSSSWLPSREEHSTPLSSPPIAMTMEGVCLSAGRHSEQCYRTHKEVVTDGFWSDPVKSGL